MIEQYTTKLLQKNTVAQNTYQILLEKPENFSFNSGQFMMLDFANPKYRDDRPTFRAMSIASAPHEDFLMFVMRGSESAFKKNIANMKEGDEIIVKGPMGHVALPEDDNVPIVFLVAGVGITPARSMIKYEEYKSSNRSITLIYASRTKDSIALYDELKNVSLNNYKVVFTLTREEGEWDGKRGRIDEQMIKEAVDEIQKPMYYIVGTGKFVDSMKEILQKMGIDSSRMQFDNFG